MGLILASYYFFQFFFILKIFDQIKYLMTLNCLSTYQVDCNRKKNVSDFCDVNPKPKNLSIKFKTFFLASSSFLVYNIYIFSVFVCYNIINQICNVFSIISL